MKSCILCGQPTKLASYDFCERCFNLTIEEIEEHYLRRGGTEIRQDQKDPCESKIFYHRAKEFVKGIFKGIRYEGVR